MSERYEVIGCVSVGHARKGGKLLYETDDLDLATRAADAAFEHQGSKYLVVDVRDRTVAVKRPVHRRLRGT